jgi:hypothetical protein
MVDPAGTVHTVAGKGPFGGEGVPGAALEAELAAPYSLTVLSDQSLLIGEVGLQRVLRLDRSGTLEHVAGRPAVLGSYAGDGGPALTARLYGPEGLGEDADGKVFIADMRNSRIRMIDSLGSIITVAGTGTLQVSHPGPGALASIGCPLALTVGRDGRVYFPGGPGPIRVLTAVRY